MQYMSYDGTAKQNKGAGSLYKSTWIGLGKCNVDWQKQVAE